MFVFIRHTTSADIGSHQMGPDLVRTSGIN